MGISIKPSEWPDGADIDKTNYIDYGFENLNAAGHYEQFRIFLIEFLKDTPIDLDFEEVVHMCNYCLRNWNSYLFMDAREDSKMLKLALDILTSSKDSNYCGNFLQKEAPKLYSLLKDFRTAVDSKFADKQRKDYENYSFDYLTDNTPWPGPKHSWTEKGLNSLNETRVMEDGDVPNWQTKLTDERMIKILEQLGFDKIAEGHFVTKRNEKGKKGEVIVDSDMLTYVIKIFINDHACYDMWKGTGYRAFKEDLKEYIAFMDEKMPEPIKENIFDRIIKEASK